MRRLFWPRTQATRVLVLMPAAIALNIALGSTVQQALKLPIYLDSVGTVITGVLAGPLAGMVTGALTNLIWAYALPPPVQAPAAAPFAVTAAVIGLLAGLWGRLGFFRSRPARDSRALLAALGVALAAALAILYTFSRFYTSPTVLNLSEGAFVLVLTVFVGLSAWALFVRRDAGAVLALAAGLATGVVAGLVSAPIAAWVFGGVTGSGGDLIIAGFRQAGLNLYQAAFQQGLISDPLDKMITCLVAFLVLSGLPSRLIARFPNGERLVPVD
jgi:energy-coupling factor transport system substrate-specific component